MVGFGNGEYSNPCRDYDKLRARNRVSVDIANPKRIAIVEKLGE